MPRSRTTARPSRIDAGYWAAHNMLADLLRDTGDTTAAIDALPEGGRDQARSRDRRSHNLAALLLDAGARERGGWTRSGARSPLQDTEASRVLLVQCVRDAPQAAGRSGVPRAHDPRAVTEVWGRPVELAGAALTLVRTDRPIRAAIRQIDDVWPRRIASERARARACRR